MFGRLFLAHPREVGESYGEHQRVALGFAVRLLGAAAACLVHALIPGLCTRTASRAITRMHEDIVLHRRPAVASLQGQSR
jgi:hypothetical protein